MSFLAVEKLIVKSADEAYAKKVAKMFFKPKYSNTIRIGLRTPQCRQLAKEIAVIDKNVYKKLIMDERHEFRVIGLMLILEMEKSQDVLSIYLELADYVTNWDLVDSSAGIVGRALVKFIEADGQNIPSIISSTSYQDTLQEMPKWYQDLFDSNSLWKVRIAIVSLLQVLKKYPQLAANLVKAKVDQMDGDYSLELNGSKFDDLDLIHKSLGWILREIGKVNQPMLLEILTSQSPKMAKITSTSGVFISSFAFLHTAGHISSLVSFNLANQCLLATREIFQSIPVETCLFGSIAVHLLSGTILGFRRKQLTANRIQATGGVLGLLVLPHIIEMRIGPLLLFKDPSVVDLTFVTGVLNKNVLFYAYYTALLGFGITHGLLGLMRVFNGQIDGKPVKVKKDMTWIFAGIGGLSLLTVLAIAGKFEKVPLSLDIEEFYAMRNKLGFLS